MQQSDALKRLLTDHTRLYAGDRVPVRFAQQPHYAGPTHGGPYLAVNPDISGWYDVNVSGANELRLLRDTLSHEAYEYRLGAPDAKAAFMARHGDFYDSAGKTVDDPADATAAVPSPKAKAAGNVYNILRDAWVNTTRCRDFPGLRRTFAFKADLLAGDEDVSELPPASALVVGLHQISLTNTATGISKADPEVRSLLATARHYVERCRTADSHEELAALADALFAKFEPVFDDPEAEFEDHLDDMADRHGDPQVEDMSDEDLADAIEDAIENAPEDADLDPADTDPDATVDADDLDEDTLDALDDMADAADEGDPAPQGDESAEDGPSDGSADDVDDAPSDDGNGTTGDTDGESEADDDADAEDHSPGGGTGGDADRENDDLLEDMDRLDGDDHAAGDMMDLDTQDDYHEPDSGDESRYEQVQHAQAFAATDWAERMDARDEYDERTSGDLSSAEIQELMRETGLAKDLRRAFARIKTAEVRESTSRPTNKLHLKNVVRHMAGDYGVRDVYETTKTGATGGRTICAVMDASGSMDHSGNLGGGCIVDAKVVLAALHLAAHEIGDRVVATAFDTTNTDDVRLITGPDETFDWDHLDGFSAVSGSTATAAGVLDGVRLLERAGGKERVMVVITDGGANSGLSGTRWDELAAGGVTSSVDDARSAVELARDEGISVIGVGVGSGVNDRKLRETFGPDGWVHVESEDLVDEVVGIYREQLDDDRVADAL